MTKGTVILFFAVILAVCACKAPTEAEQARENLAKQKARVNEELETMEKWAAWIAEKEKADRIEREDARIAAEFFRNNP
jgi:hypothetical protein